jgi:ATP-binding cassette subfamily C protein
MNNMNKVKQNDTFLTASINKCKQAFVAVFIFSFGANLLTLLTPLYSLQVLDRVLSSGSKETLLMLSIIMIIIYLALSLVQVARSFTLIKIGEWLDKNISPVLLSYSIEVTAAGQSSGGATQNLRDLASVKDFLTSVGINTLFDLPWTIIYVIVIFLIHPYLGILTVIGAILLMTFALLNAFATNDTLSKSTQASILGYQQSEIAARNAETVEAMGMMSSVIKSWRKHTSYALELQSIASVRNGIISNTSKFVRMVLQMLVTGIGAYLVLRNTQEMTVGGMIASSIFVGKALAPFDSAIEIWKRISAAQESYIRINKNLNNPIVRDIAMALPEPQGYLNVENLYFVPPNAQATSDNKVKYTIKGVSFKLEPGEILVIIGPSAAGKSTLAKLMVGIWKGSSGSVRLDGVDVYNWNRESFGKFVGYLPQGIELFNGSVKENIARLDTEADPQLVIEAALLSGAHELILTLPKAYDTDIGMAGSFLSGGQRQRIGLARAFYGNPKFVVLDEPNANLDEKGEAVLAEAIGKAKVKGITTIIISHRPSILNVADKILILQDGSVAAFGSKEEIFARMEGRAVSNNETNKQIKENE